MDYRKLAIYLTYGRKGSGKSLTQARDALLLFRSYARTEKKYPSLPKRIYFGNQKFNKDIESKEIPLGHLYYWESAKQLRFCPRQQCWKGTNQHPVHDTDIAWDEIGKDLPAGSWTETPKWIRQMFSHLRKRGNRLFANTQIYEDIDISFRRQIDFAYKIKKLIGSADITATRPKPKRIWGIIIRREFDPMYLENERDENKRETSEAASFGFPEIIFIRKRYVEAYDTTQEIPAYKADTLEHIEFYCDNDNCKKHGKKWGEPKIEHYKI